mmetsp:Transcript_3594/g.5579  ORF Transcript_3594/g.5579 Transcript_3594/m.5579 type:complete len:128 (-) Transcript_3594:162-545(-)|eukprot:CAMPEP_0185024776 /NCGR_PEP_ID=MMETSP1103-20130426/7990_1 /TAXON_ID=36769 /ORGANISM="Paraphysomonas bandaiensis, Strain Caron Lab Isolate" /LENGTH=127 /DNA_ID=CAMNT_0027557839 /DNA_START=57 /DNA_END=440 /DNA_ORIENTATION=-
MIFKYFFISILAAAAYAEEDCWKTCDDLKRDILTLEMCSEAKKVLPRPKVGDYCTSAMEKGYFDSCMSLCQGRKPQYRISQTCMEASHELPKPTVSRWCEHGYREGFTAATNTFKDIFQPAPNPAEL